MRKNILLIALVGLASSAITATGQDKVDFEKQIWPIFEKSCIKCHLPKHKDERGRTRRPKSDLVMTNKEAIIKGGENNEDNPALTPGDPLKSAYLQMTLLGLDEDEHMPPEDKAPQLTDDQKKLLEQWIKEGADFGKWERNPEKDVHMEEEGEKKE